MIDETNWIKFEAWMDEKLSICGYMAEDEADDEAPLNFYGYDGLECGSHIGNTKPTGLVEETVYLWELFTEWFSTTDIVQYLVDFANEEKVLKFRTEDDFGRIHSVELYINKSKLGDD